MKSYNTTPPPFVNDGKYLSSYFANQLSDSVNASAGFVYGANVARWIYPSSVNINKGDGIWMLQRKFVSLRLRFTFGNQNLTIKVWISKSDSLGGETQIHSQSYSNGPVTLFFDLSTSLNGVSVAVGEMYFIRVEMSKNDSSTDLFYVEGIEEVGVGHITKPTIGTLTSTMVVGATYLNQLVSASRDLRSKVEPYNMPFVGVKTVTSVNRTNTFLRWKLKHLSRYLHTGFIAATSGGGADGVILYLNDQKVKGWANNGAYVADIFDMTALPNSITEPAFGSEYELKFVVSRDTGAFTALFLWELPYL